MSRYALLSLILVTAACQKEGSGDSKAVDELTTRVKALEEENARNVQAMAFLHQAYDGQKKQQEEEEAQRPAQDAVFGVDVAGDPMDGPADALVTIVEAWDYACPHCSRVAPTLEKLVKDYDGKVRVVYKDFVVHPQVVAEAHLGGCAAGKQGKYMEFKRAFWEKGYNEYAKGGDQSKLGGDNLRAIAKGVGLDMARWEADIKGECNADVQGDMAELNKFGVNGTPAFFINGLMIPGGIDEGTFHQIIDEKLAIAQASGIPGSEYYQKEIFEKGEKKFRSMRDPKPE